MEWDNTFPVQWLFQNAGLDVHFPLFHIRYILQFDEQSILQSVWQGSILLWYGQFLFQSL